MLTRREKVIVAGIPIVIVICAAWWLWISPRITLITVAGGGWSDYSEVRHQRARGETVLSFNLTSDDARTELLDRLDFRPGPGGGNTGDIASAALQSCGVRPHAYSQYVNGRLEDGLLILFLDGRDAALVRINY